MDSHKTNLAIAKALGLPVYAGWSDACNAIGDAQEFRFLIDRRNRMSLIWQDQGSMGDSDWSPSTSPADALAALEAWCDSHNVGWGLGGNFGFYRCYIQFPGERVEMVGGTKESLICATILAAESANG